MELQIDGQHLDIEDALRVMIASRLEKLNARHEDIIHARVSLVKSHHHQHGSDEARISLAMPRRKILQAVKVGKTVEDAVTNALAAVHRELTDYRDKRRELDKQRLKTAKVGPRMSGKVVQVAHHEGYGYVDIGADEEVHFLRHAVVGTAFEQIVEGTTVEIDVVQGTSGYEASRVALLYV
jgi:ribosome-associated translation inhibitor RaiA/cold shock CspA family protein